MGYSRLSRRDQPIMGDHVQEASTTSINTTSARNLDEIQGPLAKDTEEHLLEHVAIMCIGSALVKARKTKIRN